MKREVVKISEMTDDAKTFCCSVCGKEFEKLGNLRKHQRIHNAEKPFRCLKREKHFTLASYRRSHERAHTEERPYRCS